MDTPNTEDEVELSFDDAAPGEKPGDVIGRYRLVKELGSGGFGTVWLAEQHEPVRREVALKIIKLGMDTRQVTARFEQERQALALMEHPHVARVLDAGATAAGRPYFVMDLVHGEPIAAYCDRRSFTIEARLRLFTQVCSAVQHAHGKGIIHRDLKPSNVLVDERDGAPHAVVIDFGIAKATAGKLTDLTLVTAERQVVGTLAYMSPEQAEGSPDIDTRTDVYSLGVVLYELLTGSPPFGSKAMLHEMQRMVLEVEPAAPSSKVGDSKETLVEIASRRRVEPRRLASLLGGELDWITLKALEKDRERRYRTVEEFAADVRRLLAGEPVAAAPPSRTYRLRKFVRRNRLLVGAGSAVVVALVAGVAGTTWGMLAAEEQRTLAERNAAAELAERRQAEAVASLLEGLLEGIDPTSEADGGVPLKDQLIARLDVAVKELDSFAGDPLTKARVQDALAKTLMGLAEYPKAVPLYRAALEARRSSFGSRDPAVRSSMLALATAYQQTGRQAEAMELIEAARARGPDDPPPTAEETEEYDGMAAMVHQAAGRYDDAIRILEAAARRIEADGRPDTSDRLLTLHNLGVAYRGADRPREAVPLLEAVLKRRTSLLGPDHPDTLMTMNSLAVAYAEAGRLDDAAALSQETTERLTRRYPADHLSVLNARGNRAVFLSRAGRLDEALAESEDAMNRALARYGVAYPAVSHLRLEHARTLLNAGKAAEAADAAAAALLGLADAFGTDHARVDASVRFLRNAAARTGGPEEAVRRLEAFARTAAAAAGAGPLLALRVRSELALAYRAKGEPKKGVEILKEVVAAQVRALGDDHVAVLASRHNLGCCHFAGGEFAEAIAIFEPLLPLRRAKLGDRARDALATQTSLAASYWSIGRLDLSIPMFEDSLAKLVAAFGPEDPDVYENVENLGINYDSAKRFDDLVDFLAEWQPKIARAHGGDDPRTLRLSSAWIRACRATSRPADCIPALETIHARVVKDRGADDPIALRLLDETATAYSAAKRFDRAIAVLEDLLARSKVAAGDDAEPTRRLAARLAAEREAAEAAAAAAASRPARTESAPSRR